MSDTFILVGDVREQLRTLPDDSVDCVVTSPPYWGLRDYGTARWVGGDDACDHVQKVWDENSSLDGASNQPKPFAQVCGKCGAVREDKQLGMEATLEEHIAVMVGEVFAEIHRVLKPSGTCFVNYGDCYATSANGRSAADTKSAGNDDRAFRDKPSSTVQGVMKAKDLCMMPARFAIAMQKWGWWIRSEIIWAKPNPMPESVHDRPATAHEKIYLFTKAARYDWNANDVRRQRSSDENAKGFRGGSYVGGKVGPRKKTGNDKQRGHRRRHAGFNDRWDHMSREEQQASGRNLRNYEPARFEVWEMATRPFKGAHFATFPEELARRCIAAGCPHDGVVLDPFGGAGTTALAAKNLGRRSILIELNPEYAEIAVARLRNNLCTVSGIEQRKDDIGPLFGDKTERH